MVLFKIINYIIGYLLLLRNSVVSGLSNTHNIITVSLFTLAGVSFLIIHFISIANNREIKEVDDQDHLQPPASILYMALVLSFWSSFGFYQNPALRKYGIKTVKSYFTTRGLTRGSDQRLFKQRKVIERTRIEDILVIEDLELAGVPQIRLQAAGEQ